MTNTTDYVPQTQDLFRDPAGIEKLVLESRIPVEGAEIVRASQLFAGSYPWEALDGLETFLGLLCDQFNPRVVEETYFDAESGQMVPGRGSAQVRRKSIKVRENESHPYPCVRDACEHIEFGAVLDWRMNRQRGGRNCVIDGSASMSDLVFLGDKAQLRHNCAVLGPVVIGDGESFNDGRFDPEKEIGIGGVIGRNVAVKKSIIRAGARITSGTDIVYSIIGRDVVMDPNATILCKRFDREEEIVLHRYNGEERPPFHTRHQRLGAFIGDSCKIGSVKLHPGVILMPGCEVPSRVGELLSGVYTPEYFG